MNMSNKILSCHLYLKWKYCQEYSHSYAFSNLEASRKNNITNTDKTRPSHYCMKQQAYNQVTDFEYPPLRICTFMENYILKDLKINEI